MPPKIGNQHTPARAAQPLRDVLMAAPMLAGAMHQNTSPVRLIARLEFPHEQLDGTSHRD